MFINYSPFASLFADGSPRLHTDSQVDEARHARRYSDEPLWNL